ncbi:MAG: hypothetical protein U5K75_00285 [Ahrensia sp.]|nr:hypothetical protein [Ahrensia sp.]
MALGVAGYRLERVAGLSAGQYSNIRSGRFAPRAETLTALKLALHRIEQNCDCDDTERAKLIDLIMRALIALCCEVRGTITAPEVHAQNPQKKATQDPKWIAAHEIRRMAFGLASSGLGLSSGAHLAAAGGVSRAGIHYRLKEHENMRDDADFDQADGPPQMRKRSAVIYERLTLQKQTASCKAEAVMNRRQEPMDSLEFFPTPPWATRALFEICLPQIGRDALDCAMTILDPCAGQRHMADVCAEYGHVSAWDIYDYGCDTVRHDFLSNNLDAQQFEWVIMNPPFAYATQFIQKALKTHAKRGVAALVRGNFCETQRRYRDLFEKTPPNFEFQFVERVPMHKGIWHVNGKTATAYVWLVWLKHPSHELCRLGTQKRWIEPCRVKLTCVADFERFGGASCIPKGHECLRLQEISS